MGSEPIESPLAGTVEDLARAHAAGQDELEGSETAEAVVGGENGITVVGAGSVPQGPGRTVLRRLSEQGDLEWERSYESGAARSLAALPEGGFVAAGEARSGRLEYAAHLLRFDGRGELLAERSESRPGGAGFSTVAALADGSTIAGGTQTRQGWVTGGDGEWELVIEDVAEVVAVAALPDGGFALAGSRERSTTALGMTQVMAFGADREERWSRRLPASGRGEPAGLAALPDGDLLVVGHREDDSAAQLWVVRLTASGEPIWERLLGAPGEVRRGRAVVALPDGELAVGGDALRDGRRGARIALLGGDGATRWEKGLDGGEHDEVRGLAADGGGGLLVAGSTLDTTAGKPRAAVWRVDGDGGLVWKRMFGAR